jgi:hypothetical protein
MPLIDALLPDGATRGVVKAVTVGWMLLFTWGCIRTVVSLGLRLLRLRSKPTPRIFRDVLDFTLYSVAAVVISRRASTAMVRASCRAPSSFVCASTGPRAVSAPV